MADEIATAAKAAMLAGIKLAREVVRVSASQPFPETAALFTTVNAAATVAVMKGGVSREQFLRYCVMRTI